MRTLPAIRSLALALALVPASVSSGRAQGAWVPQLRIVGWTAVERVDRRLAADEAERQLAPLDRGLALHARWRFDGWPGRLEADLERDAADDPDAITPNHDTPIELDAIPPGLPAPPAPTPAEPTTLTRSLDRVAAARQALATAWASRQPDAIALARLDLAEARALLRVATEGVR